MANVLIVAYLLIVLALIAVILLQRSEGGGLGIGGGTAGGLVSARGSANLLTRTTAILAALFMAIAIALTIVNGVDRPNDTIISTATDAGGEQTSVLDALNALQGDGQSDLAVPATDATQTTDATQAPAADTTQAPATDAAAADQTTVPADQAAATQDAAQTNANSDLAVPQTDTQAQTTN
ncbi:MAG: preprotein translocase subunit SecG [Hyphomicrobiaceae bacterium]|nr:preprotein translocase subunit SecG [Hyphomicrobiaceae bacterium]MCC0023462.1 preprotein translocase subunit SecG [Hyphomicrobiaceae bacterium]